MAESSYPPNLIEDRYVFDDNEILDVCPKRGS